MDTTPHPHPLLSPPPLQKQLDLFWSEQLSQISRLTHFRTHHLPLARIKKIMKADEDVRMIAAEAPVLFSKACELFILNLTIRSWSHSQLNKRRTLHKSDVADAVRGYEFFDFLVDVVGEGVGSEVTWQCPLEQGMGMMVHNLPTPMSSSTWQSVWDGFEDDSCVAGKWGLL